jgi:predicted AAA+ superfamily ATPase
MPLRGIFFFCVNGVKSTKIQIFVVYNPQKFKYIWIMIHRLLETGIPAHIGKGKVIVLMGARQTGKTTALKEIFSKYEDTLFLNGDESDVHLLFANLNAARAQTLFAGKRFVIIDEAQRIKDIGLRLKLIVDTLPMPTQIVATGSSSFDLANDVNEPLTGRKREFRLFPLSFDEMTRHHGILEEKRLLAHRLVFGMYPEVVANPGQERAVLRELSDSYLYKDVLMWERIKKPEKLLKLLQALALQIGSQVSYSELGGLCGIDVKTVEKYLVLLEQCFVIFRLGSFSRNIRNELKFSRKLYFYDNGIRNALLADFTIAETRRDIGALWENFLVSERQKKLEYDFWQKGTVMPHTWFWRTTSQKEIDYLEERDGRISAWEFKWAGGVNRAADSRKAYKKPKKFFDAYPDASFEIITPDRIEDFLL